MIREEIRTIFITTNGTECETREEALRLDMMESLSSYLCQIGGFLTPAEENRCVVFLVKNALEISSILNSHQSAWKLFHGENS